MGRNLRNQILLFIEDGLKKHDKVDSLERIDNPEADNDFIYRIKRKGGLDDIIVHASDEYLYTLTHYNQKPDQITNGGFILIARPEGNYNSEIVGIAKGAKISIGKWGALFGALNQEAHWDYIPKERRKDD